MDTTNLYKHQKDLIEKNPLYSGVAFGCGAGKTRTVLGLAEGKILVIAPKTQVLDKTWEREMQKMGLDLDMHVLSKEQFKKQWSVARFGFSGIDTLILDEAHCFLGVTAQTKYRKRVEMPKASQLFENIQEFIQTVRPKRVYLASATPFPQPLALWGSMRLFGSDVDYFAFRRKFYSFVPSIGRGVWMPRKDKQSEDELVTLAKKYWVFGRLEDFFDVPDQVHKEILVGETKYQKNAKKEARLLYPEPIVRIGKWHQIEQGVYDAAELEENKLDEIVSLAKEFPKLLVFCKYTKQLDMYARELQKTFKNKDILVLDGRTVDRKGLLEKAEKQGKQTIVLAQSQVSTGYELPSFRCTVFASMSYSFVDYEQALGRTQRANHISKNVYVYLIAGEIDKEVLKCVQHKKDFSEKLFAQEL